MKLTQSLKPWKNADSSKDIAVLMSGGVDSSTVAFLLKDAGWNVMGVTMRIPAPPGTPPSDEPFGADAIRVCERLDIPHYGLDVLDDFRSIVIDSFRKAYLSGQTPSPCVGCNAKLKFGLVWDVVESAFGIHCFATGHYARTVHHPTESFLSRATNRDKDQSYFLYRIAREKVKKLYFPLADKVKQNVREIARAHSLPVADKPESMELCFVGKGDYRDLLEDLSPKGKGSVLDMNGRQIAEHSGLHLYTIGQRKGLGFAAGKPFYVTRTDPIANSITVGTFEEASCRVVRASNLNVLVPERLHLGAMLKGKIRSRGDAFPCVVRVLNEDLLEVEFETPQFAPTPGQHLVLYDDDVVVGGGMIFIDTSEHS